MGSSIQTEPGKTLLPIGQTANRAGKYLSFRLGMEEFAVNVLQVKEIMGVQEVTRLPQTPPYIKGVINLRGKVIQVMDLRARFGMPEAEDSPHSCIIVVQVPARGTEVLCGITVDSVSEVMQIAETDVENVPDFGEALMEDYLTGIAKVKGKVKILVDIDKVVLSA